MSDHVEREAARERLARELHFKMEHLDPSDGGGEWEALSESQRELYRACVEWLFCDPSLVLKAL
jgi:hypothetical protein